MNQRRFSALQLIFATVAGVLIGLVILAAGLGIVLGPQGLSLLSAWATIRAQFVGEYSPEQAVDSALAGMVDGLGDRWSYYLTAEGYEAQNQRRSNCYVGVGITVSYEDERGLLILSVNPEGPASRAGLVAGEIIIAVDGADVSGESRYEGADWIMGEEGEAVKLTVLDAQGGHREVTVIREMMKTSSVSWEMLEDKVGYVALENFYSGSAEQLNSAVDALVEQGCRALVFDMRNNGGGYVGELTDMLDHLLPEGIIFRSRDKKGREEVTRSDENEINVPMAVLVNGNTYSAAEFFAAQLQETVGAAIVGEETCGKGYSQQAIALPNGGALNLSTAHYTTGNDVSLIGTGVTLDAEVILDEQAAQQLQAKTLEHGRDAQLQKAVELLRGEN